MKNEFGFTNNFIDNLIVLLNDQGCATEGDFVELYSVQFPGAMELLNSMLSDQGYIGSVLSMGNTYSGLAVYGIYDDKIINYSDAQKYLDIEGYKQANHIDEE